MGEMVEFPGKGHVDRGYMATPSGGSGPGVLVIQEYWGLVPHIQNVCDRFAGAGFTALAPDLYHGRTTFEPDEAMKELMNLDIAEAGKDLESATAHLLDSPSTSGSKIGVVGFCMGGGLALYTASRQPEIAACVPFYGVGPGRDSIDFSSMKADVLGHWGERDHSYDHETIADLESKLRDAGVSVQSYWYDADHAFFNDDRPGVYDEQAAAQAWERTLSFLRDKLH